MDFGARMRKRQQESSSCVSASKSNDIEISGKKAKRDFESQSSQSVEYDEIDLINSEPPSPVLLDMETYALNVKKSSSQLSTASNASIENARSKKWVIPEDVKNYRQTRQSIDPFIQDQEPEDTTLMDKRMKRPDPVGYVPLYPRKGCAPIEKDKTKLLAEFDRLLNLVHQAQRRSLTYREWGKPVTAAAGRLTNLKKDAAAEEQPTSFAGRINSRAKTETLTNNSDEENDESALMPYLQTDEAEVAVSQDDNVNDKTIIEEPQSQPDFALQIESDSDEDFIPVSKKPKNRRGKNKNRGAGKQQQQNTNKQMRDRGSKDRVANDEKKRAEVSQRFLRSQSQYSSTLYTPLAGRKLMSRLQDSDNDDFQVDDNFLVKSNNVGFRKQNPRNYSSVAAKGDSNEERRPATASRTKLSLARQPIRTIDVSGNENERAKSPRSRSSSPQMQLNQNAMIEDDGKVQCPMCSRMFRAAVVEEHASDCQGEADDDSTRFEADKQKCYLCSQFISLPQYSTHVRQCIEERIAKSGLETVSDDVEMKQEECSPNHIVPSTEKHNLNEVDAVHVVNQENLIRLGPSGAADLETFVPIRNLSVKLFDFNKQFASSSRPTNGTRKPRVKGGKKRKWKKKNKGYKKKK